MTTKPLQVLLVEDSAEDALLLRHMFRKEAPGSFQLTHVDRMTDAFHQLAKGGVDIVLLDLGLPDGHGMDTVRRAHAAAPDVPVIVLTGLADEALAAEAMKQGAQDYLIKGQIENRALPRALRYAIERHRMQSETEQIRINQMQFKDEFLSHVSHELRGPLTAIYQFVTILHDGLAGELTPEQHEHLGIVIRNVMQLRSMINDLLEVTRLQANKLPIELQCTSLSEAVAYAVHTLQTSASAKNISLTSEVDRWLPDVWADPTRVRQILIILIDNAIKFTPPQGFVKVSARRSETDPGLSIMEVRDSGCGISPDKTELVFERLFQAQDPASAGRQGLGLGLFICKELVNRQGGNITVKSKIGEGSTFSVTLPIFSLANLLAPAFRKDHHTENPLTLVVTELRSEDGWLSAKLRAEHSFWVRDVLGRCFNSDRDVLLPNLSGMAGPELFFIVALTDAIGGEAITRRIREKLEGSEQLSQAGLTFTTSYRALGSVRRTPNESMEKFLEQVAAKIHEAMDDISSSRTVEYER
jgi:signal transduction histidine kinase